MKVAEELRFQSAFTHVDPTEIIAWAEALAQNQPESRNVMELAGLTIADAKRDPDNFRCLFHRCLNELGRPPIVVPKDPVLQAVIVAHATINEFIDARCGLDLLIELSLLAPNSAYFVEGSFELIEESRELGHLIPPENLKAAIREIAQDLLDVNSEVYAMLKVGYRL